MNRKFLFGVPVAASLLLAICANAATTTKDIDIVVMHGTGGGTAITTMTIQNGDPSHPIVPGASGYPYIAGQAFVRSNGNGIASTGINSYPTCEDAGNNAPLACQWDDIATHRENGDDGSWRHATLDQALQEIDFERTEVRRNHIRYLVRAKGPVYIEHYRFTSCLRER